MLDERIATCIKGAIHCTAHTVFLVRVIIHRGPGLLSIHRRVVFRAVLVELKLLA